MSLCKVHLGMFQYCLASPQLLKSGPMEPAAFHTDRLCLGQYPPRGNRQEAQAGNGEQPPWVCAVGFLQVLLWYFFPHNICLDWPPTIGRKMKSENFPALDSKFRGHVKSVLGLEFHCSLESLHSPMSSKCRVRLASTPCLQCLDTAGERHTSPSLPGCMEGAWVLEASPLLAHVSSASTLSLFCRWHSELNDWVVLSLYYLEGMIYFHSSHYKILLVSYPARLRLSNKLTVTENCMQ